MTLISFLKLDNINYFCFPKNAYDINVKIKEHACETYSKLLLKFLIYKKIQEIAQNELIEA